MEDNSELSGEEVAQICKNHNIFTWSKSNAVEPWAFKRAEGVWIYGHDGQKVIDFNSMLMCCNIGHSHPRVVAKMKEACDGVLYAYPASATDARAKLTLKLQSLLPPEINNFFFTLGGAESVENAVRMARAATGRRKIMSRYRSFHGATNMCMGLTGDPRRLHNEPSPPDLIHFFDPMPYSYSFGGTEEEAVEAYLVYFEELLTYEGPGTIAAVIMETVTGSNGILVPPRDLFPRIHELLKKHGILLICDEVMAGFGRTGTMFAFENFGVVPDLVTMAKGLTSAYVPLGCVAINDTVASRIRDDVYYGGLTYNSHPFALSVALAVLDTMTEERVLDNAKKMGVLLEQCHAELKAKHPCVHAVRSIGMFGIVEIGGADGKLLAPYNGTHPAMGIIKEHFKEAGLFTFVKWSGIYTCPPLVMNEEEMRYGFGIIDDALKKVDAMLGLLSDGEK